MRDELDTWLTPSEELEPIELSDQPNHHAYIGSKLAKDIKDRLIRFLWENEEVFAWKQEDMGGIDLAVITHRLNVNPFFKPVKQKRRSFAPDWQKAINEEVSKLLQARAIREVDYSDWLANVVLVKKVNGKWRLFIDFTDVNRAYPKDSFPLLRIDLIVDFTASHELWTLSQVTIKLGSSDQEKTSFVTGQGTYCYQVMPFGLKNAGATYKRLVNKMFQKQIGISMEVYIDDMLVKLVKVELHVDHLAEAFQILKEYKMKLKPTKCAFGVSVRKFSGFIINSRGIEANLEKIRVVLNMQPPSSTKEIQRLTERIAALSRFISRSRNKCQPFFQVLKKAFHWDTRCEEAFSALKTCLSSLISTQKVLFCVLFKIGFECFLLTNHMN